MSQKEKIDFRRSIFSKNKATWVCTDQSNFDLNQPVEWILYALEMLYTRLVRVNPHMKEIVDIELRSLRNVFIHVDGKQPFKWGSGVLSGFKFTALLDSILNRAESRVVLQRLGVNDVLFEAYQGDDAIMGLRDAPSREGLVREYEKMGLKVHPQKTWISKNATEYLHEIYIDGKVLGFPARAFKAVAWASPNTGLGGTFGSAKVRALLSTLLMAYRRGLMVLDMTKRFMRSLGLSGPKVDAWLCTPSIYGGFGAGTVGRVSLDIRSKRTLTFRTQLSNIWGGKFYEQAARLRVESACPIPGVENTYTLRRFKGEQKMSDTTAGLFSEIGVVRTEWGVRDLSIYPDAYLRKLKLEWKLRSREKILDQDLPTGFLGLPDVDDAYRKYRKLMNQVLSVETGWSSSESYSRLSDWANGVWAGISFYWATSKIKEWVSLKRALCATLLYHVRTQEERGMLLSVRV
jgi:hypothetical protein